MHAPGSHTYHHQILLPEAGCEPAAPSQLHGDFFGLGLRERELTVCIVGHNQCPVKRIGTLYEIYLGLVSPNSPGCVSSVTNDVFVFLLSPGLR